MLMIKYFFLVVWLFLLACAPYKTVQLANDITSGIGYLRMFRAAGIGDNTISPYLFLKRIGTNDTAGFKNVAWLTGSVQIALEPGEYQIVACNHKRNITIYNGKVTPVAYLQEIYGITYWFQSITELCYVWMQPFEPVDYSDKWAEPKKQAKEHYLKDTTYLFYHYYASNLRLNTSMNVGVNSGYWTRTINTDGKLMVSIPDLVTNAGQSVGWNTVDLDHNFETICNSLLDIYVPMTKVLKNPSEGVRLGDVPFVWLLENMTKKIQGETLLKFKAL